MIRHRTLRSHVISIYCLRIQSNGTSHFSTSSPLCSPSGQQAEAAQVDSSEFATAVNNAMKTGLIYPHDTIPGSTNTSNGIQSKNEASSSNASKGKRFSQALVNKISLEPKKPFPSSKSRSKSKSPSNGVKKKTKPSPQPTIPQRDTNLLEGILLSGAPKAFSITNIKDLLKSRLEGLSTDVLALVNQAQHAVKPLSYTASGKIPNGPKKTQDIAPVAGLTYRGRRRSRAREISATKEPKERQDDTPVAKSGVKHVGLRGFRKVEVKKGTELPPTKTTTLEADKMRMNGIITDHPPVKKLCHELDRVLFKQGAYNLQDPRTGVYNFDHYLQHLMPAEEFDFNSLGKFITSSKDEVLQDIAKTHQKSYVGSTSSMTSVLAHFHFLLSSFRPLNFARISSGFQNPLPTFTEFTRLPAALCLRYKDGVYALDADKTYDRGTILSQLGQSMEKLLLLPQEQYEQYRLSSPEKVPEEIKNSPEAYHYSTIGNFVFRSQLDGHHDWLPGTGIFDIKTRACVTIRMNAANYKEMSGYQIKGLYGEWESFEREYVDMLRSTMLKYSLQVRMGRMDGIFVAFHNTEQIFGFQYIPLSEMDLAIHGQENLALGDQEFKFSVQMFSDILDMVTEAYPNQSVRFHFETRPRANKSPRMLIFAEPMTEQLLDATQAAENVRAVQELQRELSGEEILDEAVELPLQDTASADSETHEELLVLEAEENDLAGINAINTDASTDAIVTDLQESNESKAMEDLNDTNFLSAQIDDIIPNHSLAQDKLSRDDNFETSLQTSFATQEETAQVIDNTQVELKSLEDSEPRETETNREPSILSILSEKEQADHSMSNDSIESVVMDQLAGDEQAPIDGQQAKEAELDMATRYPKANSIFFPDEPAANSIFPLAASLELYNGIAASLKQPVYTTPVTTLWREILRQALQSPDPLDGIAARVHITIESFWNHKNVLCGISAMRTGFAALEPESLQSKLQQKATIRLAAKMALKTGLDNSLVEARLKSIKQKEVSTPEHLRALYLQCLQLNAHERVQTPVDSYRSVLSLHQGINNMEFQLKLAIIERSELYGVLPSLTPTASSAVAAVPLLTFSLEASHLIDGKSQAEASDIEYLGPWPLLQKEMSSPEPLSPPKTNKSWSVEYSIRKLPDEEGQRLYSACKERRRRKFDSLLEKDEYRQSFLKMMSKWSARGRKDKKMADKMFRGSKLKEYGK